MVGPRHSLKWTKIFHHQETSLLSSSQRAPRSMTNFARQANRRFRNCARLSWNSRLSSSCWLFPLASWHAYERHSAPPSAVFFFSPGRVTQRTCSICRRKHSLRSSEWEQNASALAKAKACAQQGSEMCLNSSALIPKSAQATRPRAPRQLCRVYCDDSVEQKGRPKEKSEAPWDARAAGAETNWERWKFSGPIIIHCCRRAIFDAALMEQGSSQT